jgi:hypothetical protein
MLYVRTYYYINDYGRSLVREDNLLVYEDAGLKKLADLWIQIHRGKKVSTAITYVITEFIVYPAL